MFFGNRSSVVNKLNANYLFLVNFFYSGMIVPEVCEDDLDVLKNKYNDFVTRKEYGKSIETALQIVAYYTPIGFLFYMDSKLASIKEQLEEGEIIEQESFSLLIAIFLSDYLFKDLSALQTFKMLLTQLIHSTNWQACVMSKKDRLFTLCQIPEEKIEEAQWVAKDLFDLYNERIKKTTLFSH
jgi:hypothetical protein